MRSRRAHTAHRGARNPEPAREVSPEILECVAEAGLRYVSDETPGITRRGVGKNATFHDASGRRVTDQATLARIRRLVIPPAWTDVWICPQANGHIQATGRDQRGRKQYRYHDDWRATRDANKYGRMAAFGRALPKIRRRVAADLRERGLGREKVLAAMMRLLETTLIRVGNDEYARENHSYGLSTLRNRHVRVRGARMTFRFTGKSGKKHEIDFTDTRLASIVARMQDLPGEELFGFVAEDGAVVDVKSDDVNAYLREIAGEEFSAKDFRTWAGTVIAARLLAAATREPAHKVTKKNLASVVKQVAERLGNTPAVCRKCYVHPAVIAAYLAGNATALASAAPARATTARTGLSAEEKAVLKFLEREARKPQRTLAEQLESSVSRVRSTASRAGASSGRRAVRRVERRARRW
jgi:DNA topoisomerase-1